MAVAGPDYECLYADVGANGRVSDGGVWNKCGLSQAIEDGIISLPPPKCLPNGDTEVPHVFVGDDAFALKPHMMKPYSQNRLSADREFTTTGTAEQGGFLRICLVSWQTDGVFF